MYTTFAACIASYYLGFYTWMFFTIKPNKLIKDIEQNKSSQYKYKQL